MNMNKKKYVKPSFEVFELQQPPRLLQASATTTTLPMQDYETVSTPLEW